jgi:hypothetical protein|tara:strand:+ start:1314 stop:1652 length:339 start_codon:yes stop_codon:yes gene_type:complete
MQKETNSEKFQDTTLGSYIEVHQRPPAFEGSDGLPYTVSIEIETVTDLLCPYVAYLVFPQWASTGLGIIGHLQTKVLFRGKTREQVELLISSLELSAVKALLEGAIAGNHSS